MMSVFHARGQRPVKRLVVRQKVRYSRNKYKQKQRNKNVMKNCVFDVRMWIFHRLWWHGFESREHWPFPTSFCPSNFTGCFFLFTFIQCVFKRVKTVLCLSYDCFLLHHHHNLFGLNGTCAENKCPTNTAQTRIKFVYSIYRTKNTIETSPIAHTKYVDEHFQWAY